MLLREVAETQPVNLRSREGAERIQGVAARLIDGVEVEHDFATRRDAAREKSWRPGNGS